MKILKKHDINNLEPEDNIGLLNIISIILTIYVLGALLVDSVCKVSPEIDQLLIYIDNAICVFFFFEFSYRFYNSNDKKKFMKWGWIDLISCIPSIGILKTGRLFRLIRLLRVIRAFRTTEHFMGHIFANKAKGALVSVTAFAVALVIFSAIAILQVETDPNSNIKTAEDAIWWSYVTITTVGYGDKYPITTEGRLIAVFLITAGVGLFGTFTAYVSSKFIEGTNKENQNESK